MAETNAERARRGFEAMSRGDLDGLGELLDPPVRWHGGDPHAPGACQGRADALAFMQRARRPAGELVDVVQAGERVVVIMRPRTPGSALTANLATFRDGRVVEMVHYPDVDDALAAAGASWIGALRARDMSGADTDSDAPP